MTNEELFEVAKKARDNARCNVSHYAVGAALLCEDDKVYVGCNIEMNEIMGLSVCAERVAFQNAIANGAKEFKKIFVVGGEQHKSLVTTFPCGVCRQYMIELNKDIIIVVENDGVFEEHKLLDLMNHTYILDEQKGMKVKLRKIKNLFRSKKQNKE